MSRREQRRLSETVDRLPSEIQKTVLGLQSQGVPKSAIADRIRYAAKGKADPEAIIDGINAKNAKKDPNAAKNAKKRQAFLKNEARKLEREKRHAKK